MARIRWSVLILFAAILGIAAAGNARVRIGAIAGTVVDAHGKPVPDATVTMQTSYGQSPSATHTDAKGHFAFERYEVGQYDLQAYWHGMFSDWTKRVVIRTDRTTEITLRLPPAADITVDVSK
ncbi:MAG TPA: carboxypeptidase-like regulatory domain-containing protein [Candidatus Baltobacteraceae bacterium]|nr:carboxypeptidase-like regulatory domain-containing protein [Candidatus Baltobacteraceae bacterium]